MKQEAKAKDVFISYKSEDRARVSEIAKALEANGVSTWMDFEDIRGGDYYAEVIVPAICASKVVLLMCSQRAVDSPEVTEEIEKAHRERVPIIPLRLEDYRLPVAMQLHVGPLQYINLVDTPKDAWLPRLIADLEARGVGTKRRAGKRIIGALRDVLADCFQGRTNELMRLRKELEDRDVRLVLVSGPQDVGKTALMTSLIKTDPAPGTALYVSMRESSTLDTLVSLLNDALPQEEAAQWREKWKDQSPLAEKFEFLFRRLVKESLWIVIDDVEKVLGGDGGIAPELMTVIEACVPWEHAARIIVLTNEDPKFSPQCEVALMTRRARLRIDRGLDRDSGIAMLRALEGDDDLGIAGSSDEFLGSLVERCSGYPGLLKMLIGYLISERNETLQQFVDGGAFEKFLDHPVLAVYDYLTAAEREVVQALAVFDAPSSKEAVESLVKRAPGAELDILDRRYVLYGRSPSIRLYPLYQRFAYEQIALQDRPALHSIAADWFQSQSKQPEEIETLADVEPYTRRCHHLMRAGRAVEAEKLLYDIEVVLAQRGFASHVAAIRVQLRELLPEGILQVRNYNGEGLAWSELGETQKALDCYMQSLALAEHLGDPSLQRKALINIGWASNDLGDYEQAQVYLTRAQAIPADDRVRGTLLGNLGDAALHLGRIDEALQLTREALQLHNDYPAGKVVWLGNLGVALQCRGEFSDALRHFQQALLIEEQQKFRKGERREYCRLGDAYFQAQDQASALRCYEKANSLASTIGDKTVQARAHLGLGMVWHARYEFGKARSYYEGSLGFENSRTADRCHNRLGMLSLQEGHPDAAWKHFDAALQCGTGSSYEARYNRALATLGRNGNASTEYQRALNQCNGRGVVAAALADLQLMRSLSDGAGVRNAIEILEQAL